MPTDKTSLGNEQRSHGPENRLSRQQRALRPDARAALVARYGDVPEAEADVIVALGGDGFMLQTLHRTQDLDAPVYGMNRGTVGFLDE